MRILIAEDELVERKAMKKFIEANFTDMVVVGEAVNGRRAIELAEKTNPDIIFMDIKMPGINGLEAIEKIYAANSEIKFILVSAYDSFDYAKESMRFGIKDYILKPGKKEEIVKALLRVVKEIELTRESKMKSTELLKELFITKAMQAPLPKDLFALQEALFPTMKSGCFFVMKSNTDYDLGDIKKALATNASYSYILFQNEEAVVMCITAPIMIEKADVLTLARKLHIVLGEDMYIGIGFPSFSLEKLSKSYHEAYEACLQLASENKSKYGFFQANEKIGNEENVIAGIGYMVEKGHSDEAIIYFKKYYDRLTAGEKEDLYINLKNILSNHDITMHKSSFTALQTDQDWYSYLHLCCMKINEFYQSKQYIAQAKKYIHNHFNEAITLENVAASVNLSPNYFSNIFKQEFGETFIDFLTKVRLRKAKELIEGNLHSLKEICFMVGYKDPNYFSRVFKKFYHESPKQYQQGIFKK
ncbi:response regulator [Jeotgalibacillus marinus]|uniref:Response regulator n=1 Tax=Jeotgalibacillus marinus TaxID=86667 RepID=A0ABV3PYX4_9BACL